MRAETEPNDADAQATALVFDNGGVALVSGAISPAGDVDLFTFTAPAGSRLWAYLDTGGTQNPGATSRDTQLRLFEGDGTTLVELDDDDGTGNGCDGTTETGFASSIADAPLTVGGTYFLRVNEFGDNAVIDPYRLHVVVTAPVTDDEFRYSANDTAATAIPLIQAAPVNFVAANISPAGDVDFYSVQAQAGDVLYVAADGDPERDATSTDVDVALLDTDGTTVLLEVDSDSSNPRSEAFCFAIATAGTYFVRVRDIGGSDTGSYAVMVATARTGTCTFTVEGGFPGTTTSPYVSAQGTQTGRLNRFSPASVCGTAKASPGFFVSTGERAFDAITLRNPAPTAACVTVDVTDACAAGSFYTAAYLGAFDPTDPTVNFLGDPGTSISKQFSFTMPALSRTVLVVHELNPGGGCDSYRLAVSGLMCANLSVTGTDTPDPAAPGVGVTYTITVTNAGPADATDVVATDVLPAGASADAVMASQGLVGQESGIVTFSLGAIASGASATASVVVTPTAEGMLTNTVSVDAAEVDVDRSDNTSTADTIVGEQCALGTCADLSVTVTDDPDPSAPGVAVTYGITVTNAGPADATDVVAMGALPAGVSVDSVTASQGLVGHESGMVTLALGAIASGASATATVVVTPGVQGTLTNTVSVQGAEVDIDPSNNTSTAETAVGDRCALVPPGPTFESLGCRLAALSDTTQAEASLGSLQPKLLALLGKFSAGRDLAESACADGATRQSKARLKQAAKRFGKYGQRLRRGQAAKGVQEAVRTALTQEADTIRGDAKALARTVQCPADAAVTEAP